MRDAGKIDQVRYDPKGLVHNVTDREGRQKVRRPAMAVMAALVFVAGTFLVTTGLRDGTAGAATTTSTTTSSTTCGTDYNGQSPCGPTIRTTLTIKGVYIGPHLVRVEWQACVIPAQGAGSLAQLYIDGVKYTGTSGTGVIGGAGPGAAAGCTPDPEFEGCLPSGTHTGQAQFANGYPPTDVVDFTVPTGVTCAASSITGSGAGTSGTAGVSNPSGSGGLAFTGANIVRLLLIAVVLLLIGGVIVYVTRERRRTSSR